MQHCTTDSLLGVKLGYFTLVSCARKKQNKTL